MSMLIPYKYMNLEHSVLSVASKILFNIKRYQVISFADLKERVSFSQALVGDNDIFVAALNLLFLLELIEYTEKNDSFFFLGKEKI